MKSIRSKFLWGFTWLALIPVILLGILTYNLAVTALHERTQSAMLAEVRQCGNLIDTSMGVIDRYTKMLIFDADIQQLIKVTDFTDDSYQTWEASRNLTKFCYSYFNSPYLLSLSIIKPSRGMFQYADALNATEADLRAESWYGATYQARGASSWFTNPGSTSINHQHFVVTRLLRDSSYEYTWDTIGIIYLAVSYDLFSDAFTKTSSQAYQIVTDGSGLTVASSDPSGQIVIDQVNRQAIQAVKNQNRTKSGVFQDTRTGDFIAFYALNRPDWYVVSVLPKDQALAGLTGIRRVTVLICLVCLMALVVGAFLIVSRITRPLLEVSRAMSYIEEKGKFDITVPVRSKDEVGLISEKFNVLARRLGVLFNQVIEEENHKKQAEIKALQYQINPHFLYNALNSIRIIAMMRNMIPVADAVGCLSRLMQNAIGKFGELVTVAAELQSVRDYIYIQNIRYSNRIQTVYDVPEHCLNLIIPNFILQPLVENAIFHGIEPKGGDGLIVLSAELSQDQLILCVWDNGVGMTQYQIDNILQVTNQEHSAKRIGIENVNQRIKMIYGPSFGLHIESSTEVGTCVRLILPRQNKLSPGSQGGE